jgi:hypothetical protein
MLRSVRSSLPASELLLSLLLAGCGLGKSGTATVEAQFDMPECQIDKKVSSLEDYRFDARYMSTERFAGILLVMIQRHRVNVEETDGVVIRLSIDDLMESQQLALDSERHLFVQPDPATPIVLSVGRDPDGTNAALSLFSTCPEFPTHPVLAGELKLDTIIIAEDPDDTGRMEKLTGTLTATLTRSNAEGRVGTMLTVFDFAPPRRPLTDFK